MKNQMCDSTLLFSRVNLLGGAQTRFVSKEEYDSISLLVDGFFL